MLLSLNYMSRNDATNCANNGGKLLALHEWTDTVATGVKEVDLPLKRAAVPVTIHTRLSIDNTKTCGRGAKVSLVLYLRRA